MLRRVFAGLLTAGLLVVATPAFAQPPVTETVIQKDVIEGFFDVKPSCEGGGPLYRIFTFGNRVVHTTTFDDGRMHSTFTETGTFEALPPPHQGLPRLEGKFTVWAGFNDNGGVVNGTFTMNVIGTGADGSTFANHVTDHFNVTPGGAEFFFTHCHD